MRFTQDHEYIDAKADGAVIGISEHAQAQLGDIVFVDLPEVGAKVKKGDAIAVVESVKAASDVFAPATGEVVAVNDTLNDQPGLVNEDAQGQGWLFKLKLADASELDGLMDSAAYATFVASLA